MIRSRKDEEPIPEALIPAVWRLWGRAGRRPRSRLIGVSMRRTIEEGVELVIEPQPKTLRLGDVVVYRRGGRSVAHRVVRRWRRDGQELLLLKGDSVLRFDPPVARSRILGRVVGEVGATGRLDYDTRTRRIVRRAIALASCAAGYGAGLYRALRYHLGNPRRLLGKLRERLIRPWSKA